MKPMKLPIRAERPARTEEGRFCVDLYDGDDNIEGDQL
jgi:hypothetical protein